MKIDFVTNTIIITKAFSEAASILGTSEYSDLNKAKAENPQMKVVFRTAHTEGRKNESKGLTYKYMRKFITVMDSDNLINFENTIQHYESYGYESGAVYQHAKEWFLDNYPNHKEMVSDAAPNRAA